MAPSKNTMMEKKINGKKKILLIINGYHRGHVNDCYCSMTLQKSLREALCTHKGKLQRQRNIPPALDALGEFRALTSNYYFL